MPLSEDDAKYLAWAIGALRQLRGMKAHVKGAPSLTSFSAYLANSDSANIKLSGTQMSFQYPRQSDVIFVHRGIAEEFSDVLKHTYLSMLDAVGETIRADVAKLGGDPGEPFQTPKPGLVMSGETIKREI